MTRHWHSTLERIVRCLEPSAESFAAAAAVYGPDLMLQLKATPSMMSEQCWNSPHPMYDHDGTVPKWL